MFGDFVAPKSATTAGDILDPLLPEGKPTMEEAIRAADDLWKLYGLYVKPEYLLDRWCNRDKLSAKEECHP